MHNGHTSSSSVQPQAYHWATAQQMGSHQTISPPPTPRLKPIPLQPTPYDSPTPHPLLTYSARPKIVYNLGTSSLLAQPHAKSGWAHEPATSPPTSSMTLKCAMLPGNISVFRSDHQHITIKDVLSAVSDAYKRAVPTHVKEKERSVFCCFRNDSAALATCFMWAGISDQIEPGMWLFHIEQLY